jgi:hypothetical protein
MIPSRVILKDEIEDRFALLEQNGISNLKALLGALSTKSKIEIFSKTTGLSTDYLTILKREVNSLLPNPARLRDLPGIDDGGVAALEHAGIRNTKQLFQSAVAVADIEELSRSTGISIDVLHELLSLSDLVRLYGVGPAFARMIYDVGITSVKDFVKCSAEDFIEIYEKETNKKADFSASDISFTLEMAKELEAG